MKKIFLLALVLILAFPGLALAASQDTASQDDKNQEDEKVRELETISAPKPVQVKLFVKHGIWASSTFRKYKNIDNDSNDTDNLKNSFENDLRFWMWMTYLKRYSVYLRFRNTYITRHTGTGYTGIGDDNEGPYLDMAYIVGNVEFDNIKMGAKAGRQFFTIGRGIAFSGTHDGVILDCTPPNFYLKSLFAHSNPKDDNVDLSVPEYDKKENRLYLGTELSYTRFYPNIFYIYGLMQRDRQEDYPGGDSQRYQYHSQYLGVGFDKQSPKSFSYWLEFIKEWGRSFMDTTYVDPQRSKINAWALDLGTRYIFDLPTFPTLEAEYALGSGDPDRTDVADTKPGGNIFGQDNNFSYYGNFSTGYALAGRLSNLEILKIQLGFTPFKNIKFTKSIDMGVKFFWYWKDRAEGPIYDNQATMTNNEVGKEWDLFLYWEPNDNFYINLKFGLFYPGDAFPDATNTPTKYFATRATLKF